MSAKSLVLVSEPILKPDLVHQLLLMFFSGKWHAGDRLPEVELAARFGVSRTPIREALQELESMGLIELRPNCGAVASTRGSQEVREIYEMREILEGAATQRACGHLEPRRLDALAAEFRELRVTTRRDAAWSRREWAADQQLHELVAQGCGNRRLAADIARQAQLVQVIREVVGNLRQAQLKAVDEHLAILKFLRANDAGKAAEAMRTHVRAAAAHAIDALASKLDGHRG